MVANMPMPRERIEGPSAWRGDEMAKSEEWLYRLSPGDVAELDGALAHTRARGLGVIEITREDFPLPRLGRVLDEIHRELLDGRGFALLRGVPVGRYSMAETAAVYFGIGTYFGRALSQNAKGHVLGHVRDLGYDPADPNVRIYQTTERQYFHTDSCDLVGLLCLRQARSGGLSAIISSVTVFNEMLARRPDLLPVLFEPFETDRRGEVPAGMKPYFSVPVFNWHAGRLSTIYVRRYIESARRFPEVPPLTSRQVEALDVFDSLLEDRALNLFMDFEPGDIQLLHNHQILHDRTGYVDWPEPERKRHLLRLWLSPPDGRPLPACFAPRYGSVEIGRRGGILVPGTTLCVPLEPR
jgi:TfdA family taurine catabolism dioxygenase TauD